MENFTLNKDTLKKVLIGDEDYEFIGNIVKSFEMKDGVDDEINKFLASVKSHDYMMTIDNMMNVGNRIFIVLDKWERK